MSTERERYGAGTVVDSRTPEDRLRERAAAVNKGIRKLGKGRWEFRCDPCGARATGPDQWTVYEYGWNHNRDKAWAHTVAAASAAMNALTDAFAALVRPVSEAVNAVQSAFDLAPPTNLPHDPSLLSDKRKWGGK